MRKPTSTAIRARLPGGERRRIAIARARAQSPRLPICDQPVLALDVSVQAQVRGLFGRLFCDAGLSALFVTHDLSMVRQIATRVRGLHCGRIVEAGPVDTVIDDP